MYDLNGKNILIVGASSGIGAGTAQFLAECGAEVILVARREEKLKEICGEIGNEKASYYAADISETENIASLISRIVAEKGKLDGLVYAAGISEDVPLKFSDYKRMMKTFNVNYFGFVECVRQIAQRSNYNKGLRIVAVSSVASLMGEKAHTAYAASKAAIDATVRCLAKELWDKGIALNTVQPGMIRTEMYDNFIRVMGEDSNANKRVLQAQYAGMGEPRDVANAIAFLLSPESRFITGISMPVDGGLSTS